VRNIHEEPRRKSLVSLITRFAEAEESPVIAEGVESEQEAEVLRACGVPFLQGYHYGRPEPYQ
jgi:EAL domain-containing protein (putative c-di-GMP-specific phosphodiesterase class I)